MPLPDDLVTDDRGGCRYVEGTDLAEHRHGQQNVASPRDERPQAAAFASQDEADRARQVGVPRGDPSRRGSPVNPHACLLELLERCREKLKQAGVWIHGAAATGGVAPWDADLTGPICLVLGSEGGGLRPLIARTCDVLLTVPMLGQVGSLNVSAATAVICYEVVRQRHARRKLLDLTKTRN